MLLADPAVEQVIDVPDGITRGEYQMLRALVPQVRDWCGDLRELGIPGGLAALRAELDQFGQLRGALAP